MGESRHHQHHQILLQPPSSHHHHRPPPHSRMGGLKGVGEIVEVQGGHIVRSTGRKDRHSKVCTAKGPRDRRVRLSAHTAIQFYDVQDRLGYDRPSKAVDWLMKKAKPAIDELEELPPWHPTATNSSTNPPPPSDQEAQDQEKAQAIEESSKKPVPMAEPVASSAAYGFSGASFLPPSLYSDAIADTIKSFFPMAAPVASSSSTSIGFQNYPPDLLSRTSSHSQDLRLSLQSFQDPILLQSHHHQNHSTTHHHHQPTSPIAEQAFFSSSSTPLAFDANSGSWSEQHHRMVQWGSAETGCGSGGGEGGYGFSEPPPQAVHLHQVFGQNPFFTQRGPLQSSNSPSIRAWMDPTAADHRQAHDAVMHQPGPSVSTIEFASGSFSGFHIPARIQGEEEHDGISYKPSSASRHY